MNNQQPRRGGSFFANVLKLVSGTTLAQLITILTAPIISRLFLPEVFGVLNVFSSIIAIISIVICLRYELAIMLPADDASAANIFALCVLIAVVISAGAGLVILFFGESLINLLKAPELIGFLWLVPIGLLIQGLFAALNYWNTRTKHFGRLSIARISASLTTSAIPITLGYLGHTNSATLIVAYLAGTFIFVFVLGIQILPEYGKYFYQNVHLPGLLFNLKRYKKFPLVDSWSSFINNLSWQLPSLMLLYYFSATVVGYYSLSNRIIVLPMTLIGSAIGQVFYQRTAELRADNEKLSRSVELVFHRLAAIGLFPAVVLGIAGPELFSIVFGANWYEAGRYAQILSPWMFVLFISSPISNLFATLERQELALIVNAVILITRFGALAIGGFSQNIYLTLLIWSVSGVLVYGGLALWLLRLTHVAWSTAFTTILQYMAYAIIPGLFLILSKNFLSSSAIGLLLATAAASLGYYGLMFARDKNLRDYVMTMLPIRFSNPG
jgi:lipopolysaccharide exporter